MKFYRTLCFCCVILTSLTCCDKGTEPPPPGPQPGKRDYVWTVDTLSYPGSFQTLMRDIWASSPKDVYVVGHNDQAGWGTMYHYDGSWWTPVRLLANQGGTIPQGFDLSAIYGFGPNDVYAVGDYIYSNPTPPPNFLDSSLIIHLDGSVWREELVPKKRILSSIAGLTKNSLWASGKEGTAYSYDGTTWTPEVIPFTFSSDYNWGVRVTSNGSTDFTNVTATLIQTGQSRNYFMTRERGSSWQLVDSFSVGFGPLEPHWGAKMQFLRTGELYSVGYGIFKRNENMWEKVYPENLSATGIWGTRKEHLFVTAAIARLLHYNGLGWYEYPTIGNSTWTYYAVWCDENEVFLVANDGLRTFIMHGR